MTEPIHKPTRRLSREIIQLMLEMNGLLRRYNISISLAVPDVYEQLIHASETIEDDDIVALRGHLIAAFTGAPQEESPGSDGGELALSEPLTSETIPGEISEPLADPPDRIGPPTPPPAEPGAFTADPASELASKTQTPGESQNVFLRARHKKSRLTCDQCQATIVLTPKQTADPPVEVQCRCGNTLQIGSDGRKYQRRDTALAGHYTKPETGETGAIIIDNISFGGVQFHTENDVPSIVHGDRLQLQFTLNNEAQSVVSKKISVRYVLRNMVGAQFVDTANFDQQLAAYLMR